MMSTPTPSSSSPMSMQSVSPTSVNGVPLGFPGMLPGLGMGMGMGMGMPGMKGMHHGMPPGMGHHKPNEELCNLIVNYLPVSYTEQQMKTLFEKYGHVEKAKLINDPVTGQSKCYGFIIYENQQEADRAIRELSGYELQGKKLRVAHAQPTGQPSPSINVFMSGFGSSLDEERIGEIASQASGGHVREVKMLDLAKHPRGVAFVRFASVAEAEACVNALNNTNMQTNDRAITLTVKYAERKQHKNGQNQQHMRHGHHPAHHHMQHFGGLGFPFGMFGAEGPKQHFGGMGGMNPGTPPTVFVHGLTAPTEHELTSIVYQLFANFGRIHRVDVPKHVTGEPRNFCFIHFADYAGANGALSFNGQLYKGRQLQVRWK
eukprot:TRINITY_DN1706_c0_g1_i1.p1 TRINITY_DN1706_c0_g1~~TRINITY_DN1706_c0_g1_i1.p1  ORF type:complete len:374 (+),score=142.17 TRINITY_DN1706_c0_g1_i1:67-1188(+)